ncbi:MAG: hypothetical protein Q9220_003788 [cf. Caloplaca sp. 1 TL-2023]
MASTNPDARRKFLEMASTNLGTRRKFPTRENCLRVEVTYYGLCNLIQSHEPVLVALQISSDERVAAAASHLQQEFAALNEKLHRLARKIPISVCLRGYIYEEPDKDWQHDNENTVNGVWNAAMERLLECMYAWEVELKGISRDGGIV